MRITTLLSTALVAGLLAVPAAPRASSAQAGARVSVSARLGPAIDIYAYSAEKHGAWRDNYRKWTPTTVYERDGQYYHRRGTGMRAVSIYRYKNEYFMPPEDGGFNRTDRRFNYKRQPNADDRARAHGRP